MKHLLAVLFLCALGAAADGATPTTIPRTRPGPPRPAPDGQRYLFVVDISSAMRGSDAANRQALFDMIFTGLDGQMRTGDSFGLWLFNDGLRAGEFPMQVWDEQNALDTASLAAKYLREQKYTGKSRPDGLMPRLLSLIKSVRDVNLLIVSNGEAPLEGTPFDANIAAVYERRKAERVKEQKPFVTALVARGGAIVSGAVVLAGEYVKLPERPAPAIALTGTNKVATPTNAVRSAVSAARANPPAVIEAGEPQTIVSLNPQPVPPPKPKVMQFVTRSNVAPAQPAPPTNAPSAAAQAPATPPPVPQPTPPPDPPRAVAVPPATTIFPQPLPVAAREPVPPLPEDAVPIPQASPEVVAVAAPPVPPPGAPGGTLLIVIGGVLLAACLVLLALVLRRTRPQQQGSVISQSMERR